MIRNYFKIALRSLVKQKGFSIINIAGLALGMAASIFLLIWVEYYFSYDKFHEKSDKIFRVEVEVPTSKGIFHGEYTPYPMKESLNGKLSGVKNWARLRPLGTLLLRSGNNQFYENYTGSVDPEFFKIFSFPILYGNVETALNDPYSIILSEEVSKKYFGNSNPVGKTIKVNDEFVFNVTAVMKDFPSNSSLQYKVLVPFEFAKRQGFYDNNWQSNSIYNYIEIENSNPGIIGEKMTDFRLDIVYGAHQGETYEQIKNKIGQKAWKFVLSPFSDIYLYGMNGSDIGRISSVKLFIALAFVILLIACINYMNMATARSAGRAKEVGLRKVAGAGKKHLIAQFMGESLLLSFVSVAFAVIIVILLLPLFNSLTGENFSIGSLFSLHLFYYMIAIALISGVISGAYPALFLSSFKPIKVLRGSLSIGAKSGFFRKSLVILQFTLSVVLIILTSTVSKQIEYIKTADVGYEKEQLVIVPLRTASQSYQLLKNELLKMPGIVNISGSSGNPLFNSGWNTADWEGKDPNMSTQVFRSFVDYDFVETMNMKIMMGRAYSKNFPSDSTSSFVINEELANQMGGSSALGKRFTINNRTGTVIGIVQNYVYDSIEERIGSLCLIMLKGGNPRFLAVRLAKNNIASGIEILKTIWNKVVPQYPFEYNFADENFARLYEDDEQMGEVFKYASVFAIIIAAVGLFGLASFIAEKRMKEIGIRKVLGASVKGITFMVSRQFLIWVLISNIIAVPVSIYLAGKWFENYALKAPLSFWTFISALILTIVIAMVTVSFKAIKAALVNPVISIKQE